MFNTVTNSVYDLGEATTACESPYPTPPSFPHWSQIHPEGRCVLRSQCWSVGRACPREPRGGDCRWLRPEAGGRCKLGGAGGKKTVRLKQDLRKASARQIRAGKNEATRSRSGLALAWTGTEGRGDKGWTQSHLADKHQP